MKKIVLRSHLCPGDMVMLTAAIRDLHRSNPKWFKTDVRTQHPALWAHNPHITPIRDNEHGVQIIDCKYPLIHQSNSLPYHFIHGYMSHLASCLEIEIKPTAFKGDIYVSEAEKRWPSQVSKTLRCDIPYWIIVAGGKNDYTIKWWHSSRWQEVVNALQGRILFVQAGALEHTHPPLSGTLDLRGKTTMRELVRLIYHSQGILCPVTSLMHLAAAIETKNPPGLIRPCVVVAGGREPAHWEAYPGHRFMHTMGALSCCSTGGCWRSRTVPLNDGDSKDHPSQLCVDVVGSLPRCMDIITPEAVVAQVESYFHPGGPWRYLTMLEASKAATIVGWNLRSIRFNKPRTASNDRRWAQATTGESPVTRTNVKAKIEQALLRVPQLDGKQFAGRGIVICGGGLRYFPSAWVNIKMLRQHGCSLPVELWHFPNEIDDSLRRMLNELNVECVEANQRVREFGIDAAFAGWEMKPLSILYSAFNEVLFMDADNMTVANPEYLFDTSDYRQSGAVFWPDYTSLAYDDPAWELCGISYRDEPEFESGQVLIDKVRHWRPLQLALWFNRHAAFFRHYFLGDKETFHFAFRICEASYSRPSRSIENLSNVTMCQHDFAGNRIFQHRNLAKWSLHGSNRRLVGFRFEDDCFEHLRQLRKLWDGLDPSVPRWKSNRERSKLMCAHAGRLVQGIWHIVQEGGEIWKSILKDDGRVITLPSSNHLLYWDLKRAINRPRLLLCSEEGVYAELEFDGQSAWNGIVTSDNQRKRIQLSAASRFQLDRTIDDAFRSLVARQWALRVGDSQQRTMSFSPNGTIFEGRGAMEMFWRVARNGSKTELQFYDWDKLTGRLHWDASGHWRGSWPDGNPIFLYPLRSILHRRTSRVDPPELAVQFPSQDDVLSDAYRLMCGELNEQPRVHRRQWEVVKSIETVLMAVKKYNLKRILVIDPPDDPLIDFFANIGLKIMCIFGDQTEWMPPSKNKNRILSLKRELNKRGLAPWRKFSSAVEIEESQIPLEWDRLIKETPRTAIVWYNPQKRGCGTTVSDTLRKNLQDLPQVDFTLFILDTILSQGKVSDNTYLPHETMTPSDAREIVSRHLGIQRDEFVIHPSCTNMSGWIDKYIDSCRYDSSHHLKFLKDKHIITSMLIHWPRIRKSKHTTHTKTIIR